MRRIYENNDLEFDNPYSGSTLKIFTTSQAYSVTKSGDTITLTWDELNSIGKGVLQYIALDSCNERIISTEYYIMADKVIIDNVEKEITTAEMLKEEIDAKVSNIVDGDVDLSVKMNTDLTTVDGIRSVALGRGLDLKALNSFASVGGVFTYWFYGSGTTYQMCSNKPKASVTISDKYYFFGAGAPLYVGATIYTTSLQPIAKILTAEQNPEKPWIMDITTDNVLSQTLLNWVNRFALVSQHTEGSNNINMGVFNDIQGSRSVALGDANKVLTDNSTVIGDSNVSIKQSNYIFGVNNIVNPSVEDNRMNITVGALNYTNSPSSLIFGMGNQINDQNTFTTLVGFGLKANSTQQPIYICGNYNATNYDANTRFVVGGGSKDTSRKNLLTIKDDGTILNSENKELANQDDVDTLSTTVDGLQTRINDTYTKSEIDEMLDEVKEPYLDLIEDNISGEYAFPLDITHLGYFGFCGHKNVTRLICHDNMTFDASGSNIRYNTKLTEVVLPNNENFTTVPQYCFANNPAITTLDGFVFPPPITTLGNYCFSSITPLKYAHLPSNITTIGQYCFNADGELLQASGEGVKTLGAQAFVNCKKLNQVDFPNLEDLQGYVFNVCNALTEVEFPKLKTIAANAFRGSVITHFVMPSSLTTTSLDSTFYAVKQLQWVDIAPSINKLNNNVFYGCTALEYVIVRNPVPPVLAATAFRGVKRDGIIYVPKGSKSVYEATVWNNSTANYYPKQAGWTIQELDEDGNIPS